MKKFKLKNDTMNKRDFKRIHIYPICSRYSEINSDKDSLISIMVNEMALIGPAVLSKITNPFILIVSEELQINIYLKKYLNR